MRTSKKNVFIVSALMLICLVLTSYSPATKFPDSKTKVQSNHILKLVDLAVNDSSFVKIFSKDLKRLRHRVQMVEKYSSGPEDQQVDSASHSLRELGFIDDTDFKEYLFLFRSLSLKFKIESFDLKDINLFYEGIRTKELSKILETIKSQNFILSDTSQLTINNSYGPGGVRPECWKCVSDYVSCLQPYVGTVQAVYTPATWNEGYIYIAGVGGYVFGKTYVAPTYMLVLSMATPFTAKQCDDYYRNCISMCNY